MQVSGTVLFYGQNHGRRRNLGAFEHSCQNAPSTFEEGVGGGRPADKSSAAAGLLQCHRLGAPPVVKQTMGYETLRSGSDKTLARPGRPSSTPALEEPCLHQLLALRTHVLVVLGSQTGT